MFQERAAALHDRQKGALDFCIEAGYERVITSDGGIFFLGTLGNVVCEKLQKNSRTFSRDSLAFSIFMWFGSNFWYCFFWETSDQTLSSPGVVSAQMAIEDFFDEFMELLGVISAEGATLSTLEVRCGGDWDGWLCSHAVADVVDDDDGDGICVHWENGF